MYTKYSFGNRKNNVNLQFLTFHAFESEKAIFDKLQKKTICRQYLSKGLHCAMWLE